MENEYWKDINGIEGYEISNLGRIKTRKGYQNRILSLKNSKGDYIRKNLGTKYNRRTYLVHRLVYENFIGPIPKSYDVHHIDGNKQNNAASNLKAIRRDHHNRITNREHPDCINAMVMKNQNHPILQFSLDGTFIAEYKNAKEASIATGVCSRNISQVANHQQGRKQAGGYIWRNKV